MTRRISRRALLGTGIALATAVAVEPRGVTMDVTALATRTRGLRQALVQAVPGTVAAIELHGAVAVDRFRARPSAALAPVVADAAQSVAMALVHAGRPADALDWAWRGVGVARSFGLADLAALNLMRGGEVLMRLGEPGLARAVLAPAAPRDPFARLAVETRLASVHAALGDAYGALSALDRAEVALDHGQAAAVPDWAHPWGVDSGFLPSWQGETYLLLRRHDLALDAFERSGRDTFRSSTALAQVGQARAAGALGDVEQACALLAAAVPILVQADHGKELRKARELRRALAPHAGSPAVRALDEVLHGSAAS